MYKEKGLIKIFNGEKFKVVSYLKEDNTIIFTTDNTSNKYSELKKNNKIKVKFSNTIEEYDFEMIEDDNEVDILFKKLKDKKAIPFFIPRRTKVIVKYKI